MRAVAIPGWMDKCCGCHACYAICPKAAIEMEYQADGFLYPKINEKLCVNCGLCSSVCPISVTREKTALLRVISGRAADSMIVRQSSSGGFFKLLAEKVLAAGGVVYGAVFDAEKKEVLCLSTDRTALANLMRSKYVQSRIGSAYKEVELALLKDREVLFSGTPCQIRGLLQYLKLHNVSGKLRTVDFICHGVPSPQYFQEFLGDIERRSKAQVTDVTFREKDKGWHTQVTKVYLSSGKTWSRESLNHPYYYYFLNDYSLRNSCYSCEEYCAHTSDLTLADDWLSSREKDDDGMSLVYVNTKMGEAMLEEIQSEIEYADVTSERTNMEVYAHDRYDRGKKKIWILYSCHPRSRKRLEQSGFQLDRRVIRHEPLGFHDYNCLQMHAFCVVSDSGTLPEESSFFTSIGHPFPAVCVRTSTERPEALDKGCFILAGIDEKRLLQAVDTAVEMNKNGDHGLPVPDYVDENVSDKVVKIIQSYTGVVNKMVWRKS